MSTAFSPSTSLASLPLPHTAANKAAIPPAVRRGAWQIAAGQAMTLKARSESVLRVRQGRLWITQDATASWIGRHSLRMFIALVWNGSISCAAPSHSDV